MPSKALATTKKAAPRKAVAKKKGEIVVASTAIYGIPTRDEVIDAIESGSKLFFDGDDTQQGSMLADKLRRSTEGLDLFAESELMKIKDHLGETIRVVAVDAVRNSDFEDSEGGLGIYLICSVVTADGEEAKMAVGNTEGIGVIVGLYETEALPWSLAFVKSEKKTKAGFFPINVVNRQPAPRGSRRPGEKPF